MNWVYTSLNNTNKNYDGILTILNYETSISKCIEECLNQNKVNSILVDSLIKTGFSDKFRFIKFKIGDKEKYDNNVNSFLFNFANRILEINYEYIEMAFLPEKYRRYFLKNEESNGRYTNRRNRKK